MSMSWLLYTRSMYSVLLLLLLRWYRGGLMLAADKRVSLTDNPRSAGFTLFVDYRPLSLSRSCRLGMCVLKLNGIVHFVFLNIWNVMGCFYLVLSLVQLHITIFSQFRINNTVSPLNLQCVYCVCLIAAVLKIGLNFYVCTRYFNYE